MNYQNQQQYFKHLQIADDFYYYLHPNHPPLPSYHHYLIIMKRLELNLNSPQLLKIIVLSCQTILKTILSYKNYVRIIYVDFKNYLAIKIL